MNKFSRSSLLQSIENQENWDVIIIGGGASGLGIAVDAASRGYKTLLLEQMDFAKGTSSRSTKLVHGGVRYLAQGNIDLVTEALFERGLMLKNAAHLVKNQSFIIPAYRWWDVFLYTVGLKMYDLLSGKLSFGSSNYITKKTTLSRIETIKPEKLKGGITYHDGQFDDSRMAVNLAQTAIEQGASVLNYFKVNEILKDNSGQVNGVIAEDFETGKSYQFNGKAIINATGVFTDDILKLDNPQAKNIIRSSQGVHLILDKSYLAGTDAIMIPKTDDGRVLFLVPWQEKLVVGTTDTPIENHNLEPQALEEEIEFILSTANRYLTKNVNRKDVLSIFAGLRPLAAPKEGSEKTKEISRSHKIIVTKSGLISIIGGKWTTYRKMAQDTLNKANTLGKIPRKKCLTKNLPIHGYLKNQDQNHHLYLYGSDQEAVLKLVDENPRFGEKLHPRFDFIKAEVIWALRYEMARSVEDILARRVRLLFLDARAALEVTPMVAEMAALELKKDKNWEQLQIKDFTSIAKQYIL